MASEPERPIEKLLREAARKRRDEAPASFEPHPATRRLLQGEVARQYPQTGRGVRDGSNWLRKVFPKLSWAVASLAVVAICVWVLSPRSSHNEQERLFARNEPVAAPAAPADAERRLQPSAASNEGLPPGNSTRAQSSTIPVPSEHSIASRQAAAPSASLAVAKEGEPGLRADLLTAANAAAGAPSLLDTSKAPVVAMAEKKAESQVASTALDRSFADKSPASTAPTGVAQSKDNAPSANLISGFAQNQPMPATVAAAPAGVAAPATPPSVSPPSEPALAASALASSPALQAVTNSVSNLSLAQNFVRSIPKSKTFAGQTAQGLDQRLLVSFQVEQNGSELRVKDEDGSVYLGYVQPAETATAVRDVMKSVPAAAGRASDFKLTDSAAQSERATAVPQAYFFRVAGTNQTLKLPVLFSGSISNTPGYGLSPTQLSGARISGRVRVGTQREFEVQASTR